MAFALVVAALVAAIAVSVVVVIQAAIARVALKDGSQKRRIAELARSAGGIVTPLSVAEALAITPLDADRLLRSMVDDVHLCMDFDVAEGQLRFWFPQLTSDPDKTTLRARRRASRVS